MKRALVVIFTILSVKAMSQEGKNMAKINLSAFALKGFNVQYERQIGPRVTLSLGYNMIPKSSVPYKSFIEKQIDEPSIIIQDFKLGTSIFTPEVRYYLGSNGAFHGFYFAPYMRIGIYKIEGPVAYVNSEGEPANANFNGKFNNITGGLMIGSSWQLSQKLYLDWWIAGAGYGGANGNLTAVAQLNADEQESLKSILNGIKVVGTTLTTEVNSNGAIIKSKGSMVGLRGFGINLGMRF